MPCEREGVMGVGRGVDVKAPLDLRGCQCHGRRWRASWTTTMTVGRRGRCARVLWTCEGANTEHAVAQLSSLRSTKWPLDESKEKSTSADVGTAVVGRSGGWAH